MKKLFTLLSVALIFSGTCFAEDKIITKKESPSKQKQAKDQVSTSSGKQKSAALPVINFSMNMLEGGYIDKAYSGYSTKDMINAIEKIIDIKKGEFESTIDFNTRKSSALNQKFLQNSSIDDTFGFVIPVTKSEGYGHDFQYAFNADTGDVNLYILPSSSKHRPLNGIGSPNYTGNRQVIKDADKFVFDTKIDSKSTYKGSNSYGATVTVDKTISSNFGIAANKIPFLKFEREILYRNPVALSSFKLENHRAAVELPSLKALIIMKLADPYIAYNFISVEPKRDNPIEILTQEKFLTGDVLGVVFYSGINGEIFARFPENFGKPE